MNDTDMNDNDTTAINDYQALPDILDTGLSVVFCGLNPGKNAAAGGHHFMGRGNRFWRTIHLAGFTPMQMLPENDRGLLTYRCGLTAVVDRPTVRADEVLAHEFKAASHGLSQKIRHYAPRYIAFLGKAAYLALSDQRDVPWGPQAIAFGGAAVWVLPNPSGLNRSFNLGRLVQEYSLLRLAASQA